MDAVLIPLAAALITGSLAGAVVLAVAWAAGTPNPWQPAAILASLAALIFWLVGHSRARKAGELERGLVVDPPLETTTKGATIRVEMRSDNGRAMDYADLPATLDQLRALADGLQNGAPLTVGSWTGHRRPFSRSEFENLRAELVRRNLAAWRNPAAPAQGCELTPQGRAVFKYLSTPTPTLSIRQ